MGPGGSWSSIEGLLDPVIVVVLPIGVSGKTVSICVSELVPLMLRSVSAFASALAPPPFRRPKPFQSTHQPILVHQPHSTLS